MKIYLVGGAVRDTLLGIESKEKDWVVVGASPDDMLAKGFKPVGRHFPVFIHPTTGEEYALARTEQKTAPGYHGFEFNSSPDVTLEEDLKRRDLTINAIAKDSNGCIIDPWGGVDDIEARKLRHISEAFAEDPVRILRVARLRAKLHRLGFVIQDETLALMRQMTQDGEADYLVAERVWAEAEKALRASNPSQFFAVLNQVGVLGKTFPELKFLVTEQGEAPSDCLDRHATKYPPEILFAVLAIAACKHQQSLIPLCQRLKLPQRYLRLARIAMQIGDELPHSEKMPHSEILKIIERCDGIRRTGDFTDFLTAWLLTDEGIPRAAQRLLLAIEKLKAIDFKTLLADFEPKEQIHKRVQEIKLQALKDI